jgi:hypothetical protein
MLDKIKFTKIHHNNYLCWIAPAHKMQLAKSKLNWHTFCSETWICVFWQPTADLEFATACWSPDQSLSSFSFCHLFWEGPYICTQAKKLPKWLQNEGENSKTSLCLLRGFSG